MDGRAQRALSSVIGLALFLAALVVLWHQLSGVTWRALLADVAATPPKALLLALLLTSLSYITLSGYDFVAMSYIRKSLPRAHVGWVSFLAYAVANNVGCAALSGASVRYRFYTRWGLTAEDLSLVVLSNSVACWLGLLMLGGVSLVSAPHAVATLPWPRWTVPVGWLFIGVAVAYVILVAIWRAPVRVRGFSVPSPRVPLALAQLTVSAIDWTLAAAVLYVLLPPSPAAFVNVLAAFLLAQLLGLASHIPGGIGVFEGLIVFGLSPFLAASQLVPALVVYRAIYYAVPLTVALMGLVVDEVLLRRAHAARFAASIGRITERMTPQMLATFTFVAGVVLLFSGATPADADRLHWLDRLLPLGVIEASHVTGSVAYGRTACGLRRLAAHALGGREGLLAWLLRTGLRRPLPGRHRRVRPAHRGVRHTLARVDGARGVNGSHAPSSRRAEERDGSALHAPDDLEQGRRLSLVRDGDGADVGIRVDADCAAVGSCRAPVVRTRHTALQTFRVCVRSRTNSTRCGSRGISCIQAGSRCCASPPTCPRWSRAAIGASSRSETHNPSSNARNSVVSRATLSSTSARVVSA